MKESTVYEQLFSRNPDRIVKVGSSEGAKDSPIPLYMAPGRSLRRNVPPDTVLTYGMIEPFVGSVLWYLREQQDRLFLEARPEVM